MLFFFFFTLLLLLKLDRCESPSARELQLPPHLPKAQMHRLASNRSLVVAAGLRLMVYLSDSTCLQREGDVGTEGWETAEYIKQALRTTLWSGKRVTGIIKSKQFHHIFWAHKSRQSQFTFMTGHMGWERYLVYLLILMHVCCVIIKDRIP